MHRLAYGHPQLLEQVRINQLTSGQLGIAGQSQGRVCSVTEYELFVSGFFVCPFDGRDSRAGHAAGGGIVDVGDAGGGAGDQYYCSVAGAGEAAP